MEKSLKWLPFPFRLVCLSLQNGGITIELVRKREHFGSVECETVRCAHKTKESERHVIKIEVIFPTCVTIMRSLSTVRCAAN